MRVLGVWFSFCGIANDRWAEQRAVLNVGVAGTFARIRAIQPSLRELSLIVTSLLTARVAFPLTVAPTTIDIVADLRGRITAAAMNSLGLTQARVENRRWMTSGWA
jgi:hypothetical protein